jgi:hypothetical protein
MATLHKYQYTFIIISHLILLRIRNAADKVVEKIFVSNGLFSANRGVCENMWKYMVETDRSQMAMQYGACALRVE